MNYDSTSSQLYLDIANRLLADIRQGRYPAGAKLPTEDALSKTFKVSRHTARHAVQELERLGLVRRRRGAGTTIRESDLQSPFVNSIMTVSELLQYATTTRLEIRRTRSAVALPPVDGPTPEGPPDEWTQLECLRYADNSATPICWTDLFLHPDVADIAPMIGQKGRAVYQLIEDRHNLMIVGITQRIDAVVMSGDIAAALKVRSGSAGLKLTRSYYDLSNRSVEIAVNIHPAAGFSYRMSILRGPQI